MRIMALDGDRRVAILVRNLTFGMMRALDFPSIA